MKKFFVFITIIAYTIVLNATSIVVTTESVSDGDIDLTNSYDNWAIFGADGDDDVSDDNLGDNVFEHNLNSSTFTQFESLPSGCDINQADMMSTTFSYSNGTNNTSVNQEDSTLYQPLGGGFNTTRNCTTLTESITLSDKTKSIDIFIQSYYVDFDIKYYINNVLVETNSSMGNDSDIKKFKLSLLTNDVTDGDVLKIILTNYSYPISPWANVSMVASGESLESSFSLNSTDIDITSETLGSASGGYKAIGSTDFSISDNGSKYSVGGDAFYSDALNLYTYTYTIKTSGDSFTLKNLYMRHLNSTAYLDSISITLKDSSGTTLLTKTAGDDTSTSTGADTSQDGTESFNISTTPQDVLTVSPLSDLTSQSGVSQIEITMKDSERKADYFGLSSFIVAVGPVAPTAPSNLEVSTTGATTMTLVWVDNASDETGYKVYKSTDNSTFSDTGLSLGAGVVTADITGLSADTKYYFIVGAYNDGGEANVTVENNTTLATAPTLGVNDINSSKIVLNWNDTSSIESAYNIYQSTTSGSGYSLVSSESAGTTTKDITGLNENRTYYFKVAVINAGGENNSSEESNSTNAKPTFTLFTDKTLTEDFGTDTSLTITDLTDSNSQDINLSVESNDTSLLSFTKSWGDSNLTFANYNGETLTLTLNSEANKSGVVELNVSAYDGFDYVSNIFNVTITAVNDTPIVNTNSTLNVNQRAGAKVSSSYLSSSDPDNNTTIYYTLVTPPTKGNLYFESNSSVIAQNEKFTQALINANDINYTNSGTFGSDSFVFKVSDQSEAVTANTTFHITISEVNLPPTFDLNMSDINISEDFSDFNISLINILDQENGDLNITVESNDTSIINFTKNWATIDVTNSSYSSDLNLTLSKVADKYGKAEFNITVDDGVNRVIKDFNITILPVDDNPVIESISNISKDMNFSEFNVSLYILDVDFGDLNLSIDVNDSTIIDINQTWYDSINEYNLTASEYNTSLQILNIKSKPNVDGVVRFTVTVEDNQSGAITKSFDLNVSAYSFVLADLNELSLTSPTTTDLTLANSGTINSSSISWSSSNSAVISNAGVVTRGSSDISVTLTASVTLANTTLTKTFDITVTANPQTASSSSSGGGGFSGSISVSNQPKFKISNIMIEESNGDIFTNSENIGTNIKADSQIELSNQELALNIAIKESNKKIGETKLKAPSNAKLIMDSSGNSIITTDSGVEIEAKRDGGVKVNHNQFNIDIKEYGSSVEISEDSSITITKNSGANISKIQIKPTGEIEAKLIKPSGVEYNFDFPINSNNKNIVLDNSALVGEYKALDRFFIVKDNNYKRAIQYGNTSVEIVPISNNTKFEEKLYLDKNYRGIILREGEAQVIVDSRSTDMEIDKEYIIIIENASILSSIYNKTQNYLYISKGWSLISSPINRELNISKTFYSSELNYKFNNNSWIKNPQSLKPNEGIWIKYSFDFNVYFDEYNTTKSYEFNSSILNSGWNLAGVGSDIDLRESSFKVIWAFDNINKKWIKNPSILNRGYGAWVKK